MKKNLPDVLFLAVLLLVAGFYVGTNYASSWTGVSNTLSEDYLEVSNVNVTGDWYSGLNNRTDTLAYPEQAASYIIFTDETTYFAKNGSTGQIDYSGTNATELIQTVDDALPSIGLILLKAGTYTTNGPLTITNSLIGSSISTIIESTNPEEPILLINSSQITLRNLRLEYTSLPDSTKTNAYGIDIIGSSAWMTWENILIRVVYGGVRCDDGVNSGARMFSLYANNVRIRQFTGKAIVNIFSSGENWNNIYINNNAISNQSVWALDWREGSTTVFNQLNIEFCNFTNEPFYIQNVRGMVINGLHFEENIYDPGSADKGLFVVNGDAHIVINGMDINGLVSSAATTKLGLFRYMTSDTARQPVVVLNGLTVRNTDNMSMGQWNLVRAHNANVNASEGAEMFLIGAKLDKAFDLDIQNYGGTGLVVRRYGYLELGDVRVNAGFLEMYNGTAWVVSALMDQDVQTTDDVSFNSVNATSDFYLDGENRTGFLFYRDDTPSGLDDHEFSGDFIYGTAGENLAIGDVVYLDSDGKYWKSDSNSSTTMRAVALALETITADASGKLLTEGYLRDDSWSAWTVGSESSLYVGWSGGDITQTVPNSSGDQVQIIGYPIASKIIMFDPDSTIVEIA